MCPIVRKIYILVVLLLVLLTSCKEKQQGPVIAPWGAVTDSVPSDSTFSIGDVQANGELIFLTISGPETYYDYHGRGLGVQYLIAEKFAQHLGVGLRVEICKDSAEVVNRLKNGRGDVMALTPPNVILASEKSLKEELRKWYRPEMIDEARKEEKLMFTVNRVKRHVYSPFLNRSAGLISKYDALFQKYAPVARWDWRLMAAQCYQESCFDPQARSWAGARGLMQIMPNTAAHLGYAKSWSSVSRYLALLSNPEYYRDPVVKNGYMRSSETIDYVERIRSRYAQYGGVPMRRSHSGGASPVAPRKAKKKYRYHV